MGAVAVEAVSPTLLEYAGGRAAVECIVDRFVESVLSDGELAVRFATIDLATFRKSVVAFCVEAFGGQADFKLVETMVRLEGEPFARLLLHLYDALASAGLPNTLTERLVLALTAHALSTATPL
jgi:truncated hemoglobin YjbI